MEYQHIPVMLPEVLEYLKVRKGGNYIDGTLGGAGYTQAISLAVGEKGKVIANDLDPMALENAQKIFKTKNINNVILINDNFKNIKTKIKQNKELENLKFDGIVLDLGLSSAQLEDNNRGFSFQTDAPLDMAFGQAKESTYSIINHWTQDELTEIFKNYGEEPFSGRIARNIYEARKLKPISTTFELVEIIKKAIPHKFTRGKIHFATRVFQALRIATNDELDSLKIALPEMLELLGRGGRIVIVSFHSLEDRIIKNFFRDEARDCICGPEKIICDCEHQARIKIITKRPVNPSQEEININPRSRSAKLRVAEKI